MVEDRQMYLNFDRQREERSVAEIAKAIEQRHAAYVDNDIGEADLGRGGIAQQASQPTVHDPKLWTVKCQVCLIFYRKCANFLAWIRKTILCPTYEQVFN